MKATKSASALSDLSDVPENSPLLSSPSSMYGSEGGGGGIPKGFPKYPSISITNRLEQGINKGGVCKNVKRECEEKEFAQKGRLAWAYRMGVASNLLLPTCCCQLVVENTAARAACSPVRCRR